MSLDLEAIRNSEGRKTTDLDVPEFGGPLRIKVLDGNELFRITEYSIKHPGDLLKPARMMLTACIVDDDDKPIFDTRTIDVLLSKPGELVMRITKEIQQICGLSDEDDEAEKKSEPMTT